MSFSLLNYINDYSTLMEYLFAKDIANVYLEIGKKFHANVAGEKLKINLNNTDFTDNNNNVYLSPHSVSNTYLMSYILDKNYHYQKLIVGNTFSEYRAKAYLYYNGYKFLLRSVFDVLNIDQGNIIEFKTTSFYKKTCIEERNYDMQAYIYSIMCNELCKVENIYFIFVRTVYPFEIVFRKLYDEEIQSGKYKFQQKLDLLINIIESHNLYHLFFTK